MPNLLGSTPIKKATIGNTPAKKVMKGTVQQWFWEHVATVTQDYDQQSIQNFFTAEHWADEAVKTFVIPRGRTMYSSNRDVAGLRTGTGRGGTLRIVNDGNILGGPGRPNSGVGGDALLIQQSGVTLDNTHQIFAGGGAGGNGGWGTAWTGGGSTSGLGGAAGGTNAGTGGTGGAGGGWGLAGATGATGATGNYTGGSGGAAGGAAGYAINLNGYSITNQGIGDRRGR